ncbi:MAG: thermostable hemolysin, partial [Pseudomonadota bacterium]
IIRENTIIRENIVEVGNLATTSGKAFRQLIVALTAYVYTIGYRYVVFTTFPIVSNSFKRMGLKLHQLADANLQQLPQKQQHQWSQEYYNLEPKVFAGDIHQGFYAISSNMHKASPELQQIWINAIDLAKQLKPIAMAV